MTMPDDQPTSNINYRIRAYEEPWPVRTAVILLDGHRTRHDIVAEWARRWPHPRGNDMARIRASVARALHRLKAAGIVRREDDNNTVTVLSDELLRMAASNLSVMVDERGRTIAPHRWTRLPAVPPDLVEHQRPLHRRIWKRR